ncbi:MULTISPECIES: hypothetical protein [Fusobacterium]|uniref:Uncharacterized protein n=1 Tax=Fusobacterium gonidiaformans 3-1-5R TaxID=469605 RepID=E5BHZ5_9FUSO|nr:MULTISPECIES: hypothetical protein [Fusobacterium]EHO21634.1 hypothetical protein HMPREF9466_00491 [Fusobacterium necrophorum subsp. funduliforme 1_1_36S]EFS22118.1 hypothetical protein FSBG_01615 [Fusobacterium gonidiaformans 3-1-5R]MBR8722388.1 hypothetical protein [Fusobacterium necrophorum subsp. funduliforme]MCI7343407.1 hypothetical protein [Fusobacterium necrophorum]MDK4477536.1 hypothetical protein [Fusobacterium necrophorum]
MKLEDFGMMTEPMPENKVEYDLRALNAHCKENGILPTDLSTKELERFEKHKEKKVINF